MSDQYDPDTPPADNPATDAPAVDAPATPDRPGALSRAFHAPPSTADVVITRILLVLVMLGAAAAIIHALWPSDAVHYVTAAEATTSASTPEGAAGNLTRAHPDDWVWTITGPTLGQRLLVAAPTVLTALLVGAGAWLLDGLVGRIHRGEFFSRATLNRLRALALLVLFGGLLVPFVEIATRFALSAQLLADAELLLHFDLTAFWPVLVGMLLLLLGQVFTRGRVLDEDLEGLV